MFMPDVLLFLCVFLQANEMRNIEQLAKSYDRDVAAIANSLTSGINRFIDVIAGNYSMKGTIGQLVEATDSLSDKVQLSLVNALKIAVMYVYMLYGSHTLSILLTECVFLSTFSKSLAQI